jgi:hypothetical protein
MRVLTHLRNPSLAILLLPSNLQQRKVPLQSASLQSSLQDFHWGKRSPSSHPVECSSALILIQR